MTRHIVATSSGGFVADDRYGARPGPLMRYVAELSGASSPRVCAIHTATGDDAARRAGFYAAVAGAGWRPSHLALIPMPNVDDVRAHLLEQDVIWVGGGSVAALMVVWRLHGLDEVLREAWEAGVVLTGGSAGSLCWHTGGTTDSFGPELRAWTDGLGFVPARPARTTTARSDAARCTSSWSATARSTRASPPTTASGCTTPTTESTGGCTRR
jgi:hypothetical protein